MNFTKEVPTKPGFYAWRGSSEHMIPSLVTITVGLDRVWAHYNTGRPMVASELGGEWCRLVAAAEVSMAWDEGYRSAFGETKAGAFEKHWADSRANRVMEGE